MAVKKLDSGKWQARISFRTNEGKFISKKRSFNTRKEAREFEINFRKSFEEETHGITYREVFDMAIKSTASTVLERSIKEKIATAERYWLHLFDKEYESITKKDWLEVWNSINTIDLSYLTKNKAIKYLKSVTKFADTHLDLKDNAKQLQLLKATSDDLTEIQTWTQQEFNTFIRYVSDDTYKALFTFYYDTGATLSEALAIYKDELRGNEVQINALMKNKSTRTRLKNRFRKRKILLAPKTLLLLEPLMTISGKYLFGGREALSNRTVPREFERAIVIANSRLQATGRKSLPRVTIHDLRHSHATNLINNGINIVAVSRRLGHSTIQTTLLIYTHLLEEKNEEIIDLIEKL